MELVREERRQSLVAIVQQMRHWQDTSEYYALTLSATADNRLLWSVQSQFAGPSGRFRGWERREASVVDPGRMTVLWEGIGQSWLAVSNEMQLAIWLRLGGNALVETQLARRWLPTQVEPREVAPNGPIGYLNAASLTPQQLRRRPTRSVGKRVRTRDSNSCRRCHRIFGHGCLSKHHVVPYRFGGLTQENNLVSLCDECHTEVDERPDHGLFSVVLGEHLGDYLDDDLEAGVRRHRRLIATASAT